MNAVKRCLALIAATLAVGACSGDPTADLAGANPTILATPGAVWMVQDKTTTVLVQSIDATGSPIPGSWNATTVGPLTVVKDTTFQVSSTGGVQNAQQWIIAASAEGEGLVIFKGTGGTDTVRVRVAPSATGFHVAANDTSPALFAPLVLTAPTGIVFTGGTTVHFANDGGRHAPVILGLSADSTQLTVMPGPGASGAMTFTGIASRSTPHLTSTVTTDYAFTAVPQVDTAGTGFDFTPHFAISGTRTTASFFDTLVVTAPANYVFLPSTTIEFFRLVGSNVTTTNPDGYTLANGTVAPIKVSLSADSTVMRWLVAPGLRGRIMVRNVAFRNAPGINFITRDLTANTFDQRSGIAGAPDTANAVWTFSKASPIAEGDTVTVTAPAGMVFLPGNASINAGSASDPSGGDSARIASFSPDSTKVVISLAPGASGKFRYANVARRDKPGMRWQFRGGSLSAAAAPAVVATLNPSTANMNDTVSIALDPLGPYRFRPTSQGILGGFNSFIVSISADSLTMKLFAPPGFTGPVTLTNIKYANLPTFQVVAATATSLTSNAATSLGADDPAGVVPIINAPDAAGKVVGFWDQATLSAQDYTGDAGTPSGAQYYRIHATRTGNVAFSVDWSQGTASNTDIDFILVDDDGSFDAPVGSVTSGAAANKPENATYALTSGTTYVLAIIDFGASGLDGGGVTGLASTTGIKVTMTGK